MPQMTSNGGALAGHTLPGWVGAVLLLTLVLVGVLFLIGEWQRRK